MQLSSQFTSQSLPAAGGTQVKSTVGSETARLRTRTLSNVIGRNAIVALLAITLGACGSLDKFKEGKEVDYKKSRAASPLEIPPDLTSSTIDDSMKVPDISISGSATYSDYSRERTGPQATAGKETVLPGVAGIQVQRDGDKRWLVVKGPPPDVWPQIREFWLQNGFLIRREDPRTGILETDWAENRADIPQGPIRSVLSKARVFQKKSLWKHKKLRR